MGEIIEKDFNVDMTDPELVAALERLYGVDQWLRGRPEPELIQGDAERLKHIGLASRYKAMEALCEILDRQGALQPQRLWTGDD
jgi:hypothetical protein